MENATNADIIHHVQDIQMTRAQNNELKHIDFFSGAGGLSCGLEQAGFKPVFASDIEPVYAETYCSMNTETEFSKGDIRDLRGASILKKLGVKRGDIDLVAGGPPCQGFSINAPIRSLNDQRNHLFKDFLRLADEIFPKLILIENVPGFISLGNGTVIKKVYEVLGEMGYRAEHKILFAAHYGVPQLRFRTIIIASRISSKIVFPEPTHNANGIANFKGGKELCYKIHPLSEKKLQSKPKVWDAISDLPDLIPGKSDGIFNYNGKIVSEYAKQLRKGSEKIYNHSANRLAPINLARLEHIPQGGSWRDIPHELLPAGLKRARRSDHTKRYGRLDPNGLCSTILTKCDPHWGSFFHPYKNRVLSVREAARIQSFPDKYIFKGNLTEQYEQVGNAVPPFMAKSIGKCLAKMITSA